MYEKEEEEEEKEKEEKEEEEGNNRKRVDKDITERWPTHAQQWLGG